ncbi:ribosome assembly RNA-binding protein YhbY [Endothiovibrio diazotrophicus]
MPLTENQKRHLRGLGHALKPVVMVGGNGLTEGVLREIELSIEHHELVKVKIAAGDRALRDAMIGEICAKSGAELVQRVGNMALLFLRNTRKPKVEIPRS